MECTYNTNTIIIPIEDRHNLPSILSSLLHRSALHFLPPHSSSVQAHLLHRLADHFQTIQITAAGHSCFRCRFRQIYGWAENVANLRDTQRRLLFIPSGLKGGVHHPSRHCFWFRLLLFLLRRCLRRTENIDNINFSSPHFHLTVTKLIPHQLPTCHCFFRNCLPRTERKYR